MSNTVAPPGPRGLRVVPRLAADPFGFCMAAAADGNGLVRIKAGPVAAYLVTAPDYVRQVLVDNASNYIKGSMMDGIRVALGNGLFTADDPDWRRQRRLMQPAFHASHVAQVGEVAAQVLAPRLDEWAAAAERGEPVDLLADTIGFNTEVVLRTLLGVDVAAERITALTELIDKVFVGMANRMWTFFVPGWVPTPGRAAYQRAVAEFDELVYRIIAERRDDPTERHDLLAMLLAARDEDDQPMSDKQLRDEICTMFIAGNESTATSTTWTCHLVGRHPEVANTLRAELDEVLAGRMPGVADLPDLPYLRAVISEGFRLYPAFPMYFRTSVDADDIGGYRIPAGAYIVVSPYATHRDPKYWPDPETFDPSRFASGRTSADARGAYYPFGIGKRRCIGEPMSLAIAQLTLAALAARFRFRTVDDPVTGRYAMTYQPKGGLRVRLDAR